MTREFYVVEIWEDSERVCDELIKPLGFALDNRELLILVNGKKWGPID